MVVGVGVVAGGGVFFLVVVDQVQDEGTTPWPNCDDISFSFQCQMYPMHS